MVAHQDGRGQVHSEMTTYRSILAVVVSQRSPEGMDCSNLKGPEEGRCRQEDVQESVLGVGGGNP